MRAGARLAILVPFPFCSSISAPRSCKTPHSPPQACGGQHTCTLHNSSRHCSTRPIAKLLGGCAGHCGGGVGWGSSSTWTDLLAIAVAAAAAAAAAAGDMSAGPETEAPDEVAEEQEEGWRELMPNAVSMKVILEGAGDPPEMGHIVSFGCVSRLSSDGTIFASSDAETLCLGDGDVVPALELAIRHLRPGGKATVRSVHRFAYGAEGRLPKRDGEVAVPPNADVTFEVTFISVLGHSDDGICEHALLRKAIGNSHFARGDYDKAINSYQKAMAKVDPSEHGNAGLKLLCDCGNNLALSCQKKGNLKGAVDATMAVLTLDPSNFKGLYRAAVVCTLLDRFEEAEAAIARAKEISPDDKSITAAQKGLLDRKKEYRSKSRELQKRMAQSLVSESKTVDSSAAETKRDKQESPHPAPEEKPLAGQAEATGTVVDDSSPTQRDEAGDTVVDRSCPPQPPAVQEPGPSVEFDAPAGATPKVPPPSTGGEN